MVPLAYGRRTFKKGASQPGTDAKFSSNQYNLWVTILFHENTAPVSNTLTFTHPSIFSRPDSIFNSRFCTCLSKPTWHLWPTSTRKIPLNFISHSATMMLIGLTWLASGKCCRSQNVPFRWIWKYESFGPEQRTKQEIFREIKLLFINWARFVQSFFLSFFLHSKRLTFWLRVQAHTAFPLPLLLWVIHLS